MSKKQKLQDLFNRSVKHIRKQGKPSVNLRFGAAATCTYRAPDGCGCAAAPFITDYVPSMEGTLFCGLAIIKQYADKLDPVAVKHCGFVRELQMCHDRPSAEPHHIFRGRFERNVAGVAARHGLTVPPLVAMGRLTCEVSP